MMMMSIINVKNRPSCVKERIGKNIQFDLSALNIG